MTGLVLIFLIGAAVFILLALPWLRDGNTRASAGDGREGLEASRDDPAEAEALRFDRLTGKLSETEYRDARDALLEASGAADAAEWEIARYKKQLEKEGNREQ
jgi:hypothetical protein